VCINTTLQWKQPYLLEREKMAVWFIRMFGRLLIGTILNYMIICHANSGQSVIDNFKFRVDLVQGLLMEHGVKLKGKCKAVIPLLRMCRILKDILPKDIHQKRKRPGQPRGV